MRWLPLLMMALAPAASWGQGWLGVDVGQRLPHGWSWGSEAQWRTPDGLAAFNEVVWDVGLKRKVDAVKGLSVDAQWRTGWEQPPSGGMQTSWRWATSARWKTDVGDHELALRLRHQFGGPWLRSWDNARWRAQLAWTHDLPKGWKLEPSVEAFMRFSPAGGQALRARLMLDKKLSKRKRLSAGFQSQHAPGEQPVQTVIVAYAWSLKKWKKKAEDPGD